jgi:uncharacterized protein (TIGR03437 family)
MGPLTRSGKQVFLFFLLLSFTICATYAQTPPFTGQCVATSVPVPVRTEGLTERLGDIQIQCSGSNPGSVLAGNLTVALPVSVTNRIGSNNTATDLLLSVDYGTGFVTLPAAAQILGNTIAFNGLSFTNPASGVFTIRISNLRAAIAQLGALTNVPVRAQLAFSGTQIPLNQSALTVALTQTGLYSTLYNRGAITCVGSPLPGDTSSVTLSSLFSAGTFFATTRLTEGYSSAFLPRGQGDDSGTRFLLQFTGLPAGARIFVPDYIAGSSAATQTAAGDLGVARSGGVFVPGSGTLLLARVPTSDSNGAGGAAPPLAGAGPIALNSASEVPVSNGTAYVIFEVLEAHPNLLESAQIPVFVGIPSLSGVATAQETVTFAPLSNVQSASSSAPIPRFVSRPPNSDCQLVGDCGASYYPKLDVGFVQTQITGVAGGPLVGFSYPITINNAGGSLMPWAASVEYANGAGWLTLDYTSGLNNASIRMNADPKNLAAGTYRANVFIDAGSVAGSVRVPITFIVNPAPAAPSTGTTPTGGTGAPPPTGGSGTGTPPGAAPAVTITRIVNAATFESTPLVAGSLGTVMGSNLAGKSVSVTFDGVAADVLYSSATQLNVRVPAAIRGKNTATILVTVDGVASSPQTVVLAAAWPAIFAHGVLNQDYSVNGPDSAAGSGSVLQIFATGIPEGATVSAQIGDRQDLVPLYAAAAPDVPGVQQVNVAVPDGVDPSNARLVICALAGSQPFCSSAYPLAVK